MYDLETLWKAEHEVLLRQNFAEADQYISLLKNISAFLEEKILPLSAEIDAGKIGIGEPRSYVFNHGICTIPFSSSYGGLGLPFSLYVLAMELVGAADASIALSIGIHNTVSEIVASFGSEEQKNNILPDLISGRKIASFALTEPTSGSDARNMNTRAEKVGDKYVLNGSKTYITNAPEADIFLVFARSEEGPTCFLVERGTEGLSIGQNMEKLGMRGSTTSELFFDKCMLDKDSVVGKEGEGFEYAKSGLNSSRIVMGSICVGISSIAYMKALNFARERKAFGKKISDFQLIREKIADMKILINASRVFCFKASRMKDLGLNFASQAAQAKIFATESALKVCDSAIQIFGGQGYVEKEIHRHWRDARLLTIGEGTSEILRMLIARMELTSSE
jgi:alkylation response protein AidB-like acyl-CoA dehydrogenase